MHVRSISIAAALLAACKCSRDEHAAPAAATPSETPAQQTPQDERDEHPVADAPALERSASLERSAKQGAAVGSIPEMNTQSDKVKPDAPGQSSDAGAGEPPGLEAAGQTVQGATTGRPPPLADERAAQQLSAPFRARPGRKLVGTAALRPTDSGTKLAVNVRDVMRGVQRVRLFRAEDCAAFGAGAGRFNSMDVVASDRLVPIGEIVLERGRGTGEFVLPAAPIVRPSTTAVVAYAPIPAHGKEVTEPIACAEFPKT